MAKLTLNAIGSRYGSIDALNDNFDAIEQALENTLSRDGTSPNALEADLDMNGNQILNASTINASTLIIGGQTLEPGSAVASATVQVFEFTATAGQTSFSVSPLTPAASSVLMEVNGLSLPTSSLVTSGSTLSFPALSLNDEVVVKVFTREIGAYPAITNNEVAANAAIVSSKLAFTQAGTTQVRSVQDKLRDLVYVSDYSSLATAISAIGATAKRLVIDIPVTVSSDLTIPSNVELRVEGSGIITVASGTRLYINGVFSCDRLHQAFNASLLSVSITANINANALNISVASANLVEAGQVVTGTGVTSGTMIAADYGVTGVGQVALNMYNGVLTNRAMTLTGASVIFGKGTVEEVYPQWWGAVADGVTDCSAAITHAIYSIRWGGKVKIPSGKYRVTSSSVLHASVIIEGDGPGDTNTGAPPTAETQAPTYIFVDADNSAIFTIPPKADHVIIRDLSLGTALTTSVSPVGTGRKGIVLNGHAPQFIFMPKIENCYLFQFQIGILINDDWTEVGDGYAPTGYYWTNRIESATAIVQGNAYEIAVVGTTNWAAITGTVLSGTIGTVGCRFLPNATTPTGTGTAYLMPTYYDWGVNPGLIQECEFRGNSYGIYFNTTNADSWRIVNCMFGLPADSSGVHLRRCGMLRMEACFAFGASQPNSIFINAVAMGQTALDVVTLDTCQAEFCSNFLAYSAASTNTLSAIFNLFNCKHELNADVYLGRMCQYNSYNTQILSYIYVQATGVRVSSINDWYQFLNYSSGPTWGIVVVSGDPQTIFTYIPGQYPSSALGANARFNGSAIKNEPNVQTVDNYNITTKDVTVAINRATTTTVVLPVPSLFLGRRIRIVTRQAQTVISSQSNITPITGGSPTNAILAATAGKWADLESDGTYWVVTASN